jgi:hypothetical protein
MSVFQWLMRAELHYARALDTPRDLFMNDAKRQQTEAATTRKHRACVSQAVAQPGTLQYATMTPARSRVASRRAITAGGEIASCSPTTRKVGGRQMFGTEQTRMDQTPMLGQIG